MFSIEEETRIRAIIKICPSVTCNIKIRLVTYKIALWICIEGRDRVNVFENL